MSESFADLGACDVKFRAPNDSAEARPFDEDAPDVAGRSGTVGDARPLPVMEDTLCDAPCLGGFCFRSCKALAKAFSFVRTKVASCCDIIALVSGCVACWRENQLLFPVNIPSQTLPRLLSPFLLLVRHGIGTKAGVKV